MKGLVLYRAEGTAPTGFSFPAADLTSRRGLPFERQDDLSSENVMTHGRKSLFVSLDPAKCGMTNLPFPTGRKFPKKNFIFIAFKTKLGQILLDSSLLVIV
jgi:hypothetical protein